MSVEFEKGDRVVLDMDKLPSWKIMGAGPEGTIWGSLKRHETAADSGFGYGEDEETVGTYRVRLDNYDYGPSEANCHSVADNRIKDPYDLSQEEIEQLFGVTHE